MRVVNDQVPQPFRNVSLDMLLRPNYREFVAKGVRLRSPARHGARGRPHTAIDVDRRHRGRARRSASSACTAARGSRRTSHGALGPGPTDDFRELDCELYLGPPTSTPASGSCSAATAGTTCRSPPRCARRRAADGLPADRNQGSRAGRRQDRLHHEPRHRGRGRHEADRRRRPARALRQRLQEGDPDPVRERTRRVSDMGFPKIGYQTFKLLAYQSCTRWRAGGSDRYPGVDIILIEPDTDDELMSDEHARLRVADRGRAARVPSVTVELAADDEELRDTAPVTGSRSRRRACARSSGTSRPREGGDGPGGGSSSRPPARCCASPRANRGATSRAAAYGGHAPAALPACSLCRRAGRRGHLRDHSGLNGFGAEGGPPASSSQRAGPGASGCASGARRGSRRVRGRSFEHRARATRSPAAWTLERGRCSGVAVGTGTHLRIGDRRPAPRGAIDAPVRAASLAGAVGGAGGGRPRGCSRGSRGGRRPAGPAELELRARRRCWRPVSPGVGVQGDLAADRVLSGDRVRLSSPAATRGGSVVPGMRGVDASDGARRPLSGDGDGLPDAIAGGDPFAFARGGRARSSGRSPWRWTAPRASPTGGTWSPCDVEDAGGNRHDVAGRPRGRSQTAGSVATASGPAAGPRCAAATGAVSCRQLRASPPGSITGAARRRGDRRRRARPPARPGHRRRPAGRWRGAPVALAGADPGRRRGWTLRHRRPHARRRAVRRPPTSRRTVAAHSRRRRARPAAHRAACARRSPCDSPRGASSAAACAAARRGALVELQMRDRGRWPPGSWSGPARSGRFAGRLARAARQVRAAVPRQAGLPYAGRPGARPSASA